MLSHYSRAIRSTLVLIAVLGIAITPCLADKNIFVIVSDTQNIDGVDQMTKEIIELNPPFVISVGDCPSAFDPKVNHFQRLREAGIEVHIAMGNHDGGPKGHVRSTLPPYPLNSAVDPILRFMIENKYYYSFNSGGIHFCIADSSTSDKEAHYKWLEDDLIHHVNNPDKLPTIVFMHYPDWMTKSADREVGGPIYEVLAKNPDKHTVKAGFAGHTHLGINYPLEETLGIPHYALYPSAPFGVDQHTEYIIANVNPDEIVFERKVVLNDNKGKDFFIRNMPGKFTTLTK